MYRLYYFRKSTNLRLRKHLTQMLLFPMIDYCCVVYNNLSNDVNSRLQTFVNSAIRYSYSLKRWEYITPYRRELGWLTTTGRAQYFAANLLCKIFNTATPSYQLAFFYFAVATRPVRGEIKPLDIRGFGTETLKKSFHISSAYLWNSLPSHSRNITSVTHFKSCLHQHLFNSNAYKCLKTKPHLCHDHPIHCHALCVLLCVLFVTLFFTFISLCILLRVLFSFFSIALCFAFYFYLCVLQLFHAA